MKIGDQCQYRDWDTHDWKDGTVLDIQGPVNARIYVVAGSGHAAGELVTKTDHYVCPRPLEIPREARS
jgi:hypothetical protein